MNIIWEQNKNEWLILNRGISFEEISDKILNGEYIEILENPNRENQQYFIMNIKNYTWIIPFLINQMDQIVLKTAFPSRKFHKKYGENNEILNNKREKCKVIFGGFFILIILTCKRLHGKKSIHATLVEEKVPGTSNKY
jgi:uncharacterized DUF497 family protein